MRIPRSRQGNRARGIQVADSTAALSAIVTRRQRLLGGELGIGLAVEAGASVVAEHVFSEGDAMYGVVASAGGRFELTDAIVLDTRPAPTGFGIRLDGGATALVRRAHVAGSARAGADVRGPTTDARIEDLVVRDAAAPGSEGCGIDVRDGASLELRRARVEGAAGGGLCVVGVSYVTVSDLRVSRTGLPPAGPGRGVLVAGGAVVHGQRWSIAVAQASGLRVADRLTEARVSDLTIGGTDGAMGDGNALVVAQGAMAVIERLLATGNRTSGVLAAGDGTVVALTNADVRDTRPWRCAMAGSCPSDEAARYAAGIIVLDRAEVSATRFSIARNVHVGVDVRSDSVVVLANGRIEAHEIGAWLPSRTSSFGAIGRGVLFLESRIAVERGTSR